MKKPEAVPALSLTSHESFPALAWRWMLIARPQFQLLTFTLPRRRKGAQCLLEISGIGCARRKRQTGAAGGVTPGGGTIKASFLELNGDTVTQGWQSGGPVVGVLDPDALSCSYDQPCPVLGVTNHLSVPYVYNWDANMEQSL